MKGIVIENINDDYILDMKDLYSFLGENRLDFNWLLTDYECNDYPTIEIPINNDFVFLEGDTLKEIVYQYDIQFIWSVFSGFDKKVELDHILDYPLPMAEGNTKFWSSGFKIQNPLASVEIVVWDSSLVIILTEDEELLEIIKKSFPKSKDLEKYNEHI